jgi:predicted DNA-binding transcriptional regulator AlpA
MPKTTPKPPEVRAQMWQDGERWYGRIDRPDSPTHSVKTRAACLARLRKDAGRATLTVEVVPALVGVAEAAGILGWDKRRVFTYISRDSFPEPIAMLASGRVWRRRDIEDYAKARAKRRT